MDKNEILKQVYNAALRTMQGGLTLEDPQTQAKTGQFIDKTVAPMAIGIPATQAATNAYNLVTNPKAELARRDAEWDALPEEEKAKQYIGAIMSTISGYHGGTAKFDEFDLNKLGTGVGQNKYGKGFYFSDSPLQAKRYGQAARDTNKGSNAYLYETEIHKGKKPSEYKYFQPEKRFSKNEVENMIDVYESKFKKMPDWMREETINRFSNVSKDYTKNRAKFLRDNFTDPIDDVNKMARMVGMEPEEVLKKLGYSGVKFNQNELIKGAKGSNYVVFDPKDISIKKISEIPLEQ